MKKIPSALKWLAEKRARVAGQLQASEATLAHIDHQVAALEKELAAIKAVRGLAAAKVAQFRSEVATLDSTVLIYDNKIDPSAIGIVKGWSGRYGKLGAFATFCWRCCGSARPSTCPARSSLCWR